ncbi:MAG: glycosyltransferase family 2 protein [Tissierellia bacterium]|nr:glycosyltransferase family 2 protein [Tissierellia bacterium]
MNQNQLVSIIVPIYNSYNKLYQCLKSIQNQTYHNIEVLLINDGSSDDSCKICEEFCKIDNRFKYFYQDNAGVSSARNVGIELSNGTYIQFVDSDDYIKEEMTENMVKYIQNVDWVFCGIEMGINKNLGTLNMPNFRMDKNNFFINFSDFYRSIVFQGPCNKLYLSSIIKSNNIRFDVNFSIAEDSQFNARYLKFINNIQYVNEKYYIYYNNNSSLTHLYSENSFQAHKELFSLLDQCILTLDIEEYKKANYYNTKFRSIIIEFEKVYKYDKNAKTKIYYMMQDEFVNKACKEYIPQLHNKFFAFIFSHRLIKIYFLIIKSKQIAKRHFDIGKIRRLLKNPSKLN